MRIFADARPSQTTHISTPFPLPDSTFRFSYRGDRSHIENEIPIINLEGGHGKIDEAIDVSEALETVKDESQHSKRLSLNVFRNAAEKDEGAMDVDEAEDRIPVHFMTPGPKPLHRHNGRDGHSQNHSLPPFDHRMTMVSAKYFLIDSDV